MLRLFFALLLASFCTVSQAQESIPQPSAPTNWSDSYSVDGQCYCDSTYDHGLASAVVSTPAGRKTVPTICSDITARFGSGNANNRVYYNTIQCGFEPANNAADESVCPGIPRAAGNYTGSRCQQTGAKWNLELLYPVETLAAPVVTSLTPVTTAPAVISYPTCLTTTIDYDSDGYAWENNQTCVVGSNTTITLPVTEAPTQTDQTITFPACTTSVTDFDGDGYAWENNQTCVVGNNTPIVTQPVTDAPTQADQPIIFPTCSTSVTDFDGDGYAWENNQSCSTNTAADTATPTASNNALIVNPLDFFPACSSTVTDDNGDGYSWENNQSCYITSTTPTVNAIPYASTPDQTPDLLALFPACGSTIRDDNGDGYGWENNQSCIITAISAPTGVEPPAPIIDFPTCSSGVSDTDGDGYAWENNRSCAIDQAAAPAVPIVGPIEFPTCSSAANDPDGDGYSWENNQTCLIAAPTNSTIQTIPPTVTSACGAEDEPNSTYNQNTDLIVLHFDFGRDPDDGHAAVADKVLLDHFAIQNYWVVSGTNSVWQNNYIGAADGLLDSVFGQGNWQKANILNRTQWNTAVVASGQRWTDTLSQGGDVWIAEGGPGDFTADVLRSIQQQSNECNWKNRIHLIQHSTTNETNTGRSRNDDRDNDLAYTRSNTHYVKIADGNSPNATADLYANNNTQAQNATFVNQALNSSSRRYWQAGFNFLGPGTDGDAPVGRQGGKLDFSDTVELLHILGVPTSQVRNWTDFARNYF